MKDREPRDERVKREIDGFGLYILEQFAKNPPPPYKTRQLRPPSPELEGPYIYAVLAEEVNRVKIGYSKNPPKRIYALRIGSPVPVKIIGYIKGSMEIEQKIHTILHNYRTCGEWFDNEGVVKDFVKAICNKDFDALESLLEV